jgi:hypothetical protein
MWWPWRRRRTPNVSKGIPMSPQTGAEARVQANEQLRAAHEQLSRTARLTESLKTVAARNHFGESMIELFRGVR